MSENDAAQSASLDGPSSGLPGRAAGDDPPRDPAQPGGWRMIREINGRL